MNHVDLHCVKKIRTLEVQMWQQFCLDCRFVRGILKLPFVIFIYRPTYNIIVHDDHRLTAVAALTITLLFALVYLETLDDVQS
jgi:hypothetical protein